MSCEEVERDRGPTVVEMSTSEELRVSAKICTVVVEPFQSLPRRELWTAKDAYKCELNIIRVAP